MTRRADRLVQRGGQWCAVSEDGQTSFGCFDTEAQARERLRQVEAAVAAQQDSRSDGQVVTRCDRLGPIRVVETQEQADALDDGTFAARLTDEGFLRVEGRISGVGVYQYSDAEGRTWGELRTAAEVFHPDSLASFQLVPVTDDHPDQMVDVRNVKDLQCGHLGSNVRKSADGRHVVADMLITDASLIAKIKAGKTALSNGYQAVVLQRDGVTEDGTPFEAIQTQIRGNHNAVVDVARGPGCRLLFDAHGVPADHADHNQETTTMKVKKKKDGTIVIGETEHEVPDAVSAAFEAMQEQLQALQASEAAEELAEEDATDLEEDSPAQDAKDANDSNDSKEEIKADAATLAKMQARIDMLESQLEGTSDKIDARVNLVAAAREVLGAEVKTDGVGDLALKKAVVGSIMPTLKKKVDASKSADYVDAMYEAAMERHASRVDTSTELLELTHQAARGDGDDLDVDALYTQYTDGLSSGTRRKEAN